MRRRMCIEIDQELLGKVMEFTGARTKSEAVEIALRTYLRVFRAERRLARMVRRSRLSSAG